MGLRLAPAVAARERRLERLLAECRVEREDPRLAALVEDALLVGSLELAGIAVAWDSARAAGEGAPEPLRALRHARGAVRRGERLTPDALLTWHAAIAGPVGLRRERSLPGALAGGRPPGAPPALVAERLASLCEWLDAPGSEPLGAEQKAAVALARLAEIRPFDDANGRVARLAAAQLLERAGLAPPILVEGDRARLHAALAAAFRLDTGPLVELVREAASRPLAVMIQSLERGLVSGDRPTD